MYDVVAVYMGFDVEDTTSEDREWTDTEWVHFADIPFTSLFDIDLPSRADFDWDRLSILIEDSEGTLETIPMEVK